MTPKAGRQKSSEHATCRPMNSFGIFAREVRAFDFGGRRPDDSNDILPCLLPRELNETDSRLADDNGCTMSVKYDESLSSLLVESPATCLGTSPPVLPS